jgi:hypothetical protein
MSATHSIAGDIARLTLDTRLEFSGEGPSPLGLRALMGSALPSGCARHFALIRAPSGHVLTDQKHVGPCHSGSR